MAKPVSGRWHTVYSIVSTLLEEAGVILLMAVILPAFGVDVPLWGTVTAVVAVAVYSYIMYKVGHPVVLSEPFSSPDAIVGKEGVVEVDLKPSGYIRVEGELWKAVSAGGHLLKGDTVVITHIKGLGLTVERKS